MPIGWLSEGGGGDSTFDRNEPPATEVIEQSRIVVWTRWRTAEDERVCPECGPLDWVAWPEGEGPRPPLHDRCRCVREFAFAERVTAGS